MLGLVAGPDGAGYRRLAVAFTAGFLLMGGLVLGYLAGTWLDARLGTDPWLTVAGVVLGAAAGFHSLVRQLAAGRGREDPGARRDGR